MNILSYNPTTKVVTFSEPLDLSLLKTVRNGRTHKMLYDITNQLLCGTLSLDKTELTVVADTYGDLSTDELELVYAAIPVTFPSEAITVTVEGGLTNDQLRAAPVDVTGPVTNAELRATALPVATGITQPLTDTQLRATPVPVATGGLTDTQLRATPVPVATGLTQPLTDAQIRATALPVATGLTQPLTDAQLRATALPVSGPLTNAELRATPLQVLTQDPMAMTFGDTGVLDAFGRLRVSNPIGLHESQMTYNLLPIRIEQITTNGTITHDATNRCALLSFAGAPANSKAIMQTYETFLYRPGRSHLVEMSFNFQEGVPNVTKFAGYSDGVNGIEFQLSGSTKQFVLYSGTSLGNLIVPQANWNQDKLDGTGPSGLTLDITKTQLLIIDLQALYVGRVRIGFNIGGVNVIAHHFEHANVSQYPYIQYASLPVRCGMTSVDSSTTSMRFICSSVIAEGGDTEENGLSQSYAASLTAANGVDTHAISIRPSQLFYGFRNNSKLSVFSLEFLVTGNSPIKWKLCIGQALTGTTAFTSVGSTSGFEVNTAGTASGSPFLVIEQGFVSSSSQSKGEVSRSVLQRIPITLDAAGLQRLNGTLTVLVQGIGASSACQVAVNWRELR